MFVQLARVKSTSLSSRDVRKIQEMIYVNCFKLFFFFFFNKKGRDIQVLTILFIQPKIPLNYSPCNLYLWIEAAMPREQRPPNS